MTTGVFLSLAAGVVIDESPDGAIELTRDRKRLRLTILPAAVAVALRQIADGGRPAETLAEDVRRFEGVSGLAQLHYQVERLLRRGWLVESARREGRSLATLQRISSRCVAASVVAEGRHVLSRFAFIRRVDQQLVLESPLGYARVVLDDVVAVAVVQAYAQPCAVHDLATVVPGLDAASAIALAQLLHHARALAPVDAEGRTAEDANSPLRSWEFHDLLFHTRSRTGRHDTPVGASLRFAGRTPPPASWPPPRAGEAIALTVPDMRRAVVADPPFADVQERRRSIRHYGHPAISASQLGAFLYRVARVIEVRAASFDGQSESIPADFTVRPYPSGGGLYELELYVAVVASADLAPGLYHYDTRQHRLEPMAVRAEQLGRFTNGTAARAGLQPGSAQIVFGVTARFDRVAWKYESMAYALVLKHVGVLYQTMYLVATALDLAPCAIGSGDTDLFAAMTGIDYYEEGLVGEFLVGTRPDG